jgi:hypothetical protein
MFIQLLYVNFFDNIKKSNYNARYGKYEMDVYTTLSIPSHVDIYINF